jgi:predicted HicB family RNase H-like nuclease
MNKGYEVVAARPRDGGNFTASSRPKSKKPVAVRLYQDLEEKLHAEAIEKGISIAQLILEKLDTTT